MDSFSGQEVKEGGGGWIVWNVGCVCGWVGGGVGVCGGGRSRARSVLWWLEVGTGSPYVRFDICHLAEPPDL